MQKLDYLCLEENALVKHTPSHTFLREREREKCRYSKKDDKRRGRLSYGNSVFNIFLFHHRNYN